VLDYAVIVLTNCLVTMLTAAHRISFFICNETVKIEDVIVIYLLFSEFLVLLAGS
jgi:hypothetical protein